MRNLLLLCLLAVATSLHAQAPAAPPAQPPAAPGPTEAPAATVPPVPAALPMAGPSGMVFHTVKADRTAEFEAVMTRLRDLLAVSGNEVRRQQAAGWRVFRQVAPLADGAVLYVSVLDPVVANAEYDVPRLLAEAAPAEAAQLYEQFRDAHVQPTVQASNLSLVVSLVPGASTTAPAATPPAVPKP
jgi:hypothetical protein